MSRKPDSLIYYRFADRLPVPGNRLQKLFNSLLLVCLKQLKATIFRRVGVNCTVYGKKSLKRHGYDQAWTCGNDKECRGAFIMWTFLWYLQLGAATHMPSKPLGFRFFGACCSSFLFINAPVTSVFVWLFFLVSNDSTSLCGFTFDFPVRVLTLVWFSPFCFLTCFRYGFYKMI